MSTVQQRTTARLLRRALEAALPPKNHPRGVVDAVAKRVEEALPPERDAKLLLPDVEEERVAPSGRDPRRRWFSSMRHFNPYCDLFTYRRVASPPWDAAWKNKPLVLGDVDLLHAFDFPPYVESEPHEFGESINKILESHAGPVDSLRVDASVLPPPEKLGEWLDQMSARGARELVLLDVGAPPAPDKAPLDFPMSRLRCPGLATLALGFVAVRFGRCSGLSGLQELLLVSCGCSGRDLSMAVANLYHLKTLGVFAVDLAAAAAGAAAAASGDGALEISSESLSSLELMEATATALTLLDAPALGSLVAGVVSPEVKNPRVRWPRTQSASPPVRISVRHAPELQSIRGLVLCRRQRISVATALDKVETLEAELSMGAPEQWSQVLNLAAHLPALRCLELTRTDACRADEHLEVEPVPDCFGDSLRHLSLHAYRAGGAEVSLVTTVLATAQHLVSVKLYPHSSHPDPVFADFRFLECPRLSPAARIELCQSVSSESSLSFYNTRDLLLNSIDSIS